MPQIKLTIRDNIACEGQASAIDIGQEKLDQYISRLEIEVKRKKEEIDGLESQIQKTHQQAIGTKQETQGDGNCLLHALLGQLDPGTAFLKYEQAAQFRKELFSFANYLNNKKIAAGEEPFALPEEFTGEQANRYLGDPELDFLVILLNQPIHVLTPDQKNPCNFRTLKDAITTMGYQNRIELQADLKEWEKQQKKSENTSVLNQIFNERITKQDDKLIYIKDPKQGHYEPCTLDKLTLAQFKSAIESKNTQQQGYDQLLVAINGEINLALQGQPNEDKMKQWVSGKIPELQSKIAPTQTGTAKPVLAQQQAQRRDIAAQIAVNTANSHENKLKQRILDHRLARAFQLFAQADDTARQAFLVAQGQPRNDWAVSEPPADFDVWMPEKDAWEFKETRIHEIKAELSKAKQILDPALEEILLSNPTAWANDIIAYNEDFKKLNTEAPPEEMRAAWEKHEKIASEVESLRKQLQRDLKELKIGTTNAPIQKIELMVNSVEMIISSIETENDLPDLPEEEDEFFDAEADVPKVEARLSSLVQRYNTLTQDSDMWEALGAKRDASDSKSLVPLYSEAKMLLSLLEPLKSLCEEIKSKQEKNQKLIELAISKLPKGSGAWFSRSKTIDDVKKAYGEYQKKLGVLKGKVLANSRMKNIKNDQLQTPDSAPRLKKEYKTLFIDYLIHQLNSYSALKKDENSAVIKDYELLLDAVLDNRFEMGKVPIEPAVKAAYDRRISTIADKEAKLKSDLYHTRNASNNQFLLPEDERRKLMVNDAAPERRAQITQKQSDDKETVTFKIDTDVKMDSVNFYLKDALITDYEGRRIRMQVEKAEPGNSSGAQYQIAAFYVTAQGDKRAENMGYTTKMLETIDAALKQSVTVDAHVTSKNKMK